MRRFVEYAHLDEWCDGGCSGLVVVRVVVVGLVVVVGGGEWWVVVDVVVSTVGWWWGDKKNLIRIIDNVTLTLNIRRLFLNNG